MNHKKISLTAIYGAIRKPNSSTSLACQHNVRIATVSEIDEVLRRLLSYANNTTEQWNLRRLMRCLDYIFIHNNRSSDAILAARSMRSCVRLVVELLGNYLSMTEPLDSTGIDTVLAGIKFISHLLERLARINEDENSAANALLIDIRRRRGIYYLLQWTDRLNNPERYYCLRALTAKGQFFAQDLLEYDALDILAKVLSDILGIFSNLDDGDEDQLSDAIPGLDQCQRASLLLEALLKRNQHAAVRAKVKTFAESGAFISVVEAWHVICTYYRRPARRHKVEKLMYSLSAIVRKSVAISETAADRIASLNSRCVWQPVLVMEMQRFLAITCTVQESVDRPPQLISNNTEDAAAIASHVTRLCRLCSSITHRLPNDTYRQAYINQILRDITNFMMMFVSRPVLYEEISQVGNTIVLPVKAHAEVGSRNFQESGGRIVEENEMLLVSLLDNFIQHVQLSSSAFILSIAKSFAFCVQTFLMVMEKNGLLSTSALLSRLQRIIVLFLCYDDAVDQLENAPKMLDSYIWSPTINHAKDGLMIINGDVSLDTPEAMRSIRRAKRALFCLETISRHSRACQKILECDVLGIAETESSPCLSAFEKIPDLLELYALFVRLIAYLASRMAFVRTTIREKYQPTILLLLSEAIRYKRSKWENSIRDKETNRRLKAWNCVISHCLQIVCASRYDDFSLQSWSMPLQLNGVNLSLIPLLFSVLWPSHVSNHQKDIQTFWEEDYMVISQAAVALQQLSTVADCVRHMLQETPSLGRACELLVQLTSDSSGMSVKLNQPKESVIAIEDEENIETAYQIPDTVVLSSENMKSSDEIEVVAANAMLDTPKTSSDELKTTCAKTLFRTLRHIITSKDNVQAMVIRDTLTAVFRPLVSHSAERTQIHWRTSLRDELMDKRRYDFQKLFEFTKDDERAVKCHELAAVAIGYACPNPSDWEAHLGINTQEHVVYSKSVFGNLCHMIVYDLEYDVGDGLEDKMIVEEELSEKIMYCRRNSAAQVIKTLAFQMETTWRKQLESFQEQVLSKQLDVGQDSLQQSYRVSFITDSCNIPISADAATLMDQSRVFEALLSGQYQESRQKPILLGDVAYPALEKLLNVMSKIRAAKGDGIYAVPLPNRWNDVIDLLQLSDRFACDAVWNLCERWILHNLMSPMTYESLEGCLLLYRRCRNPENINSGLSSSLWSFDPLLQECLKTLMKDLSFTCTTKEFNAMIKDNDHEELEAFCDGMATLLCATAG
ncbi:hypothetical protein EC973_008875 [Apophysomyces ossiformis]|uniref:BTB domain-containing protein n=1 Tax=Apophysomyces ossiformis TaxID=679940 RepID=A0A8H7BV15_9FUNG|nr:hypothetical protein EC973_008875 [Apophysomyces ossiformis]